MTDPRTVRRRLALPMAVALAAALAACSCRPPRSDDDAGPTPAVSGAEALRALPYVRWSGGADPSKSGVVRHDAARAWPGLNLYTDDRDTVLLLDMDGRPLHRWRLPATEHRHCEYAEVLDPERLAVVCVNDALFVIDRRSRILLEHRSKVHHDLAPLPDGGMIVPDKSIHYYRRRMVYFDELHWLDRRGSVRRRFSTWDQREALQRLHPPLALDQPGALHKLLSRSYDYYHLNTVEVLQPTALGERDPRFRAGNLLVCLRNPALVLVLDQDSAEVVWSWGPGELDGPHMPTLLDDGLLLIFDNGTERDHSRVIELDPETERVTWEYRSDPPEAFHSKWRGSAQRLPNGNTLICESDRGHAFEVTREGQTVWEFWNPELRGDRRRGIYRFLRIEPSRLPWAAGAAAATGTGTAAGEPGATR